MNFTMLFHTKYCAGCAIRKLHLAALSVLFAIRKLQLGVRKEKLQKSCA
jgi:hypothetical protein